MLSGVAVTMILTKNLNLTQNSEAAHKIYSEVFHLNRFKQSKKLYSLFDISWEVLRDSYL